MNNYFMETHHHEWILTNKLGGYALGTGNLINQRKYHGLLVASNKELERTHLVAGIEEKVEWRGEIIHLDSNNYSSCIYPEGFLYLVKPWLRPYPIFLYSALPHQDEILIRKEIFMDEFTNTVLVKYTNLGQHKLHLELHPKYTMHDHHEINLPGSLDNENFETQIDNNEAGCIFTVKRPANKTQIYGYASEAEVFDNRFVYYNVFYPWDVMKGYSGVGDQITFFEIRIDLKVGEEKYLVFSDQPIEAPSQTIRQIIKRYEALPLPHDYPHKPDVEDSLLLKTDFDDDNIFNYQEYMKILEFALTDFIIDDDLVSGYPWYSFQSADTMFFVKSILKNPEKIAIASKIIDKYKRNLQAGLLPTIIAQSISDDNPVSLEAGFGLITALDTLSTLKNDSAALQHNIEITEQILTAVKDNDTYPFSIREDGLIELHEDYAHATWMNAVVDEKPVTPRNGAPVELNAMWYNAIFVYETMCKRLTTADKTAKQADESLLALRDKIKISFQKFWVDNYLADRLIGDEPVKENRPNAVIAAAQPNSPLFSEQQLSVFEQAFKALFTFYGLRTLHPTDTKFQKKYYGNQHDRDISLHNGTVWAWLLEPFCELTVKLFQNKKPDNILINQVTDYIGSFRKGIMKGHIATIAEIWDGDAPHFPKGSPALARNVAALYNVELLIKSLKEASL